MEKELEESLMVKVGVLINKVDQNNVAKSYSE